MMNDAIAKPSHRAAAALGALSIVLFGALGATQARAHTDVRWSVSIGLPLPIYGVPAPVYAPPPAVHVRPAPVVVYGGAPVYHGGYRGHGGGYGHYGHQSYGGYQGQQGRWDHDRDGVPDRYDRRRY
jgi:hypothetical protein